ncbi:hypothetical protein PIB30_059483 [Stylosanthes scabra]|uniref:Uncharacterized protein n=1 Tax=Stylosanthes scabra TaxID=79078 RepID=A0ABU6RKM5_9FABA|nr:hypothetical protein [Stylosanthes scabra]
MELVTKKKEEGKLMGHGSNDDKEENPTTIGEIVQAWKGNSDKLGGQSERWKCNNRAGEELEGRGQGIKNAIGETGNYRDVMVERKGKGLMEDQHAMAMNNGGLYFVELADDEEDASQNRIEMEWEKKLAMEISIKLHLKRRREDSTVLMIKEREEEGEQKEDATRKRTRMEQADQAEPLALLEWKVEQQTIKDMAEEAGQFMPHREP